MYMYVYIALNKTSKKTTNKQKKPLLTQENHYLRFWDTFGNSNVFNLFPTASGRFLIF